MHLMVNLGKEVNKYTNSALKVWNTEKIRYLLYLKLIFVYVAIYLEIFHLKMCLEDKSTSSILFKM